MPALSTTLKALLAALGIAAAGTAATTLILHPKPPSKPAPLPAPKPAPAPAPKPAPPGSPAPAPSPGAAADAARVISFAIPAQMTAGTAGTFSVVVRNDGTATWDDGWRLGVVDDFQGDGTRFQEGVPSFPDLGRVHLAPGTKVSPGQSYTFTFPVVAPLVNRTYDVKLRMVHESVTWFGETAAQMVTVVGPPPIPFPTYEAMRRFRGDLAGMKMPDLKQWGASDVFFTAVYPAYPDYERAKIRAAYKAKGYTHLPISLRLGDYHGLYPQYDFINTNNVAGYRAILSELWRDGLIPVVFVIDDQEPAQTMADMDRIKQKYTPFLSQLKDLVFVTASGWEINGWMSPEVMTESAKWLKQTLPDALVYIHFTSGHAAGSGPTQGEADWWKGMMNVLQGILYQHDGPQGGQAVADRLADFTIRFQTGYHSWPQGFDVIAFEYSAYWQVNQGGAYDEAWGDRLGDDAMSKTNPPIQGYCDGGTLNVGGALPPCPWLPAAAAPNPTPGAPPTTPTPPATPPALVAPTVQASTSGTLITWSDAGRGGQGYVVDIDDDSDWNDGFFNQGIQAGQTSVSAPAGFNPYGGAMGTLVLNPGATYRVRIYYPQTQEHSPDASFTVPAGAPAPMPGGVPKDEVDLSQAVIHNSPGDVAGWPATAKLTTLDLQANGVFIDFTKRDGPQSWPDVPFGKPGDSLEYTLWIVKKINGQWHASGCIQYWRGLDRNGGPPSQYAMNWYYDTIRWGVMVGQQPAVGEQVGFFVTAGDARNNGNTLVKERSNVVLIPFPTDSGAKFSW